MRDIFFMLKLWGLCALMSAALTGCGVIDEAKAFLFPQEEAETVAEAAFTMEEDAPVIVIDSSELNFDITVDREPTPTPTPFVYEEIRDDVNKIYSRETADPEEVTLTFVGDISFAEGYANMGVLYGEPDRIKGCIKPEVLSGLDSDIFMANNEFPYSSRGSASPGKKFTFRAKPESVSYLTDMKVDIVSLGNNHAYDYGAEALSDTIDILNGAGIPFVGAGKNLEEAMKPVYFKVNGRTVAYTSATQIERLGNPDTKEATEDSPGVLRTFEPSKMVSCIQNAAQNSDFVVVYVHWGSENTDLVDDSQKKLAKEYVAAGADLIIGDHSHCLQGIDYIEGVPVIYSLGNFWFNSRTLDTGYIKAALDTSQEEVTLKTLEFVPCIQTGCHTYLADEGEKARILEYLQGISFYAQISEEGLITASDSNHNIQNGANTSPSRKFLEENKEPEPEPALDPLTELLLQQQAAAEALNAAGDTAGENAQAQPAEPTAE
ncbi:MAG TPA: capsule biosynthesis protein [Lachnospiraceae bacterium]|nr:capsule biosynthesis protein [Lachnospiraceae bacterium]